MIKIFMGGVNLATGARSDRRNRESQFPNDSDLSPTVCSGYTMQLAPRGLREDLTRLWTTSRSSCVTRRVAVFFVPFSLRRILFFLRF